MKTSADFRGKEKDEMELVTREEGDGKTHVSSSLSLSLSLNLSLSHTQTHSLRLSCAPGKYYGAYSAPLQDREGEWEREFQSE